CHRGMPAPGPPPGSDWHGGCCGAESRGRCDRPARRPHHRALRALSGSGNHLRAWPLRAGRVAHWRSTEGHPILVGSGMRLRDLLIGAELRQPPGNADIEITRLAYHNRQVTPGTLFFAVRGEKTDGNRFVSDAIERGASAVVSEASTPP